MNREKELMQKLLLDDYGTEEGNISDDYMGARMALAKELDRTKRTLFFKINSFIEEDIYPIPKQVSSKIKSLDRLFDYVIDKNILSETHTVYDPIYENYYMLGKVVNHRDGYDTILIPITETEESLWVFPDIDKRDARRIPIRDIPRVNMLIQWSIDRRNGYPVPEDLIDDLDRQVFKDAPIEIHRKEKFRELCEGITMDKIKLAKKREEVEQWIDTQIHQ